MNFIGYFNTDVRFMYNVYKGGGRCHLYVDVFRGGIILGF